jgi:hypothetical protein
MSASLPAMQRFSMRIRADLSKMIAAGSRHIRASFRAAPFLLAALLISGTLIAAQGPDQDESMGRIPMPTKKTMTGTHRAFSGKVETLDLKRKVLIVATVEGGGSEIFPIKKGISVSGARGKKMKLQELSPGTNIIVYYDYRDGKRLVNEIMVLAVSPAKKEAKKESPPSS